MSDARELALENTIFRLETSLESERKKREWQPIETAPKDGTEVLIFDQPFASGDQGLVLSGKYRFSGGRPPCRSYPSGVEWPVFESHFGTTHTPTHWMPLPDPPE